jgi:hypothetical protein
MPYSIELTVRDLLGNDTTKAIIEQHLPGFSSYPQFGMAQGMGLSAVAKFSSGLITAWLLYAAGPKYLLRSTIFFVIGIPEFWYAQREKDRSAPAFTPSERAAAGMLCVVAVIAAVLFATKMVPIG